MAQGDCLKGTNRVDLNHYLFCPSIGMASNCGEGHQPRRPRRQELGAPQEGGCQFPGNGGVRATVSVLVLSVGVGVFFCDHAGLIFNKFSLNLMRHVNTHSGDRPYPCITCVLRLRQPDGSHAHPFLRTSLPLRNLQQGLLTVQQPDKALQNALDHK